MRGRYLVLSGLAVAAIATSVLPVEAEHGAHRRPPVASGKGDRLVSHPTSHPDAVAKIEVLKRAEGSILTMRDGTGMAVYVSDGGAGVTRVVRNVVIPAIHPAAREKPAPAIEVGSGRAPDGCEKAVSVLAKGAAGSRLSRCLS